MNLTDREVEVLSAYATGRTKAEVGRLLFISEDTVKKHLSRISSRIGAVNSMHAVALADRAGLLRDFDWPPIPDRPRRMQHRPPPPGLAERFPSTTWGELEWFAMLHLDDQLFHSILRGIGRASA